MWELYRIIELCARVGFVQGVRLTAQFQTIVTAVLNSRLSVSLLDFGCCAYSL